MMATLRSDLENTKLEPTLRKEHCGPKWPDVGLPCYCDLLDVLNDLCTSQGQNIKGHRDLLVQPKDPVWKFGKLHHGFCHEASKNETDPLDKLAKIVPKGDGQSDEAPFNTLEDMLHDCLRSTLERVGLTIFHWSSSRITIAITLASRPHLRKHFMVECVVHCCWTEVGRSSNIGSELIHGPTEGISNPDQAKDASRYFGKMGKLNPRYVGPFKVIERVGEVAYKLKLPEEFSRVHNTFHVSNLKKCHADEPLVVPLDGLHLDHRLHFVEEPLEIVGV
ncbi:hypothetical protein Tco_0607953 [Tanacetum coccineum]